MKKQLLSLSLLALLSTGCTNTSLFQYEADDSFEIHERATVGDPFNTETLLMNAEECSAAKSREHYEKIVDTLKGVKGERVFFYPIGDYQDPSGWDVLALPNVLGYKTMEDFKADFAACSWRAGDYPLKMSEKVLMFGSSCGSGYDDGSGRKIACNVAKEAIAPTIVLE